jgi:hypothetical protein
MNILTSELRKQSNRSYLFEEISKDYKDEMIEVFQDIYSISLYNFTENLTEECFNNLKEITEYISTSGIEENINRTKIYIPKENFGLNECITRGTNLSKLHGDTITKDFLNSRIK